MNPSTSPDPLALQGFRASGVRPIVLRPKGQPTSILLEPELVQQLREKGRNRGLGYQTMLKLIVREHLHEY